VNEPKDLSKKFNQVNTRNNKKAQKLFLSFCFASTNTKQKKMRMKEQNVWGATGVKYIKRDDFFPSNK